MNELKNYYNKWVKEFFSTKGVDAGKVEITPNRDWKIIAICFFTVLVISLGFNIYMSFQINNDSFFTAAPKKYEGVTFNRDGLTAVLSKLAAKEASLSQVSTTTASVVDPSR